MKKLIYKLTTRSRPAKMWSCIDNIKRCAHLSSEDYLIVISADEDDFLTNTRFNVASFQADRVLIPIFGHSRSKIDAVNRDAEYCFARAELVIATSDDVEFMPGADELIYNDYKLNGPDTALHYGDGFKHGLIWTVPILDKAYYDRFGYIYNPEYVSLFCDEEAVIVGRENGRMKFCDGAPFVHRHPAWTGQPPDAQYKRTESYYPIDKKTFERRKANNFAI